MSDQLSELRRQGQLQQLQLEQLTAAATTAADQAGSAGGGMEILKEQVSFPWQQNQECLLKELKKVNYFMALPLMYVVQSQIAVLKSKPHSSPSCIANKE